MCVGLDVPDLGEPLRLQVWTIPVHSIDVSHTDVTVRVQRVDWRILECFVLPVAFMESRNGEYHIQLTTATRNLVGIWVLLTHFYSNQCHLDQFIHVNTTIIVHVVNPTVMVAYRGRTSS